MRILVVLLMSLLPQLASAQSVERAALEAAAAGEASANPVEGRFAFLREGLGSHLSTAPAGLELADRSETLVIDRGRPIGFAAGYGGYLMIDHARPQSDGSFVVYLQRREAGGSHRSLGGADLRITVAAENGAWRVVGREVLREY